MTRDPECVRTAAHGTPRSAKVNAISIHRATGAVWPLIFTGLAVLALLLWVTGCNKGGTDNAASGAAGGQAKTAKAGQGKGGGHGGPNGGQRSSQPPIPIAVEAVATGPIASYYTTTATLTAEKEAEILARATGIALERFCEEGDWVEKGQILLQIEDNEYRLRVAQAEANAMSLKDRYERLKGMFDENVVSQQEFESAKNEFAAAEAAEGLARLELSYAKVRAPFTGRIVSRLVDIGRNVSVGTPLFVISDFDPLLAVVYVPSKEFKKLSTDQPVTLVLDSSKERMQGHIKLVSPIIDPTSGTIKVTVEIPEYPEGTRPGDFAQVSIVTERRTGCTLVPKIAVFTDHGDKIIYVAADSTAERRVVEVGFEDDHNSEILSGVSEGERVVVKGQRSLKHGSPVKIVEQEPAAVTPPPTARRAGS